MAPLGKKNCQFIHGIDKFRTYNWLNQKYCIEGLSLSQIADIVGVHYNTVYKWLKKLNIKTRSVGSRTGEKHARFKGYTINSQGYKLIYSPDHPNKDNRNYVREHILVAEKYLNRLINPNECIHHIDENKLNNNIENLYLFSDRRDHDRYHQMKRMKSKEFKSITKSNILRNG